MIFLMTILPLGVSEYWVGEGAGFRQGPHTGPSVFPRLGHWPTSIRPLKTPLIPDAPASVVPQDGPDAGIDFRGWSSKPPARLPRRW